MPWVANTTIYETLWKRQVSFGRMRYLNLLHVEDLFGLSAEKVSERIAAQL